MTKRKCRTVFRPDVEIEVELIEFFDLQRQGLIHDEKPAPKTPAPSPAAGDSTEKKEAK